MQVRYGMSRGPGPRIGAPLAIGSIVLTALVAGWLAFGPGRSPIQVRMLQWEQVSTSEVRITYAVRKPEGLAAVCAVRTQDRTSVDSGFAVVPVPSDAAEFQQTVLVTTLAPIAIAEVLGCAPTAEGLPAAAFPPGVAAPTPAFIEPR